MLVAVITATVLAAGETPKIGQTAPDFALASIQAESIRLSQARKSAPVVLVVLRGYPGYQCPLCTRQVAEVIRTADAFAGLNARVLMVYPGKPGEVHERAREFLMGKALPPHFDLLLDPDYTFTNLYGLRWNAEGETAYPSAFVIDSRGTVRWSKISRTHGGRASSAELVEALKSAID